MPSENKHYEEQISQSREYRDGERPSIWSEVVRKGLPDEVTFEQSLGLNSTPSVSFWATCFSSAADSMLALAVLLPSA